MGNTSSSDDESTATPVSREKDPNKIPYIGDSIRNYQPTDEDTFVRIPNS